MNLINKLLQNNENENIAKDFTELLTNLVRNINSLKKDLYVFDSLYSSNSLISEEIFDSIILDLQYIDYDKFKLLSKYDILLSENAKLEEKTNLKELIKSLKSYLDFILTSFEEKEYRDVSAVLIKNEMKRVFNFSKYTTQNFEL